MLVLDGKGGAGTLAFTADGTRLVVGRHGTGVDVWSLPDGRLLHDLGPFGPESVKHTRHLASVAVHPAGRVAFVTFQNPLSVVSLTDGTITTDPAGVGRVYDLIASPDGGWVVASSLNPHRLYGLRCTANGELHRAWDLESDRYGESPSGFVDEGRRFVSVNTFGQKLEIRETETGAVRATAKVPSRNLNFRAVSPDGRRFALMGYDKMYAWDAATWGTPTRVQGRSSRPFVSFAFHPTRPLFAAVQWGQTLVKVFDAATWKLVARYQWKLGDLLSVAYSPDGNLAAAGAENGKVVVWDVDE